jgi:micrococcal nuclease
LLVCCSINPAQAAETKLLREQVVAVFPDASIQLAQTGKAVFANTVVLDVDAAASWLAAHVLQQEIHFTAADTDRYGRTRITSDIEDAMLRDGVSILYASAGDIPTSQRVAEAAARGAKHGVWASEALLLTPEAALKATRGFHVIEGTITRIYEGKSATYINFGQDWHSDFSITIYAKQRRSMKAFLASLTAGDRVRVRGSIIDENGPMIRLNHPANLEHL